MSFIDFKKLLPGAIARYNVERETQAAHICERFREVAPSILGKEGSTLMRPKYFKRGTLTIAVPSSLWAQRLVIHRHDLIMKLNLSLEHEWVNEIRPVVETV